MGRSLARVLTSAISGMEALSVDVEVQVRKAIPGFTIIGLGDSAVRESRDRILSSLQTLGVQIPPAILINLAPAELKKEGAGFDLSMAVGILVAAGHVPPERVDSVAFHGELALDGTVRAVRGVVAHAVQAVRSGRSLVVPHNNVAEARLISGLSVVGVGSLGQVISHLRGDPIAHQLVHDRILPPLRKLSISEVWGQRRAKRALTIAASGGHNLLMIGPPGCGKSMLAERFSSLLPPLTRDEMLEVVNVHSIAGLKIDQFLSGAAPYRNPHHMISDAGLVGGGSIPRPGEISLAHRGVLFLDEFPEFRRTAIEALRAPLESGAVLISRARGSSVFPARFQLIAAMNPCPCGRLGSDQQQCICSRTAVQAYLRKLSGPILDRIDLHVELDAVPLEALATATARDTQAEQELQESVLEARERQYSRLEKLNACLSTDELREHLQIDNEALGRAESSAKKIGLSARGYVRVLRVARTVADLEASQMVYSNHVAEALGFRSLERLQRATLS